MAFQEAPGNNNSNPPKSKSLYPSVIDTDTNADDESALSQPTEHGLYPTVLITENPAEGTSTGSEEEILIRIPGATVHLIDRQETVELASGEFMLVRLVQGGKAIAVFARIDDQLQWPLAKDEAAVRLNNYHYFFSLRLLNEAYGSDADDDEYNPVPTDMTENMLNYGLTFTGQPQELALEELDKHLEHYTFFSVHQVSDNLGGLADNESGPSELFSERSAAFWTTVAPNVEDYSGSVARGIAAGSGQIVRGILWCGDVTVDQLRRGNEFLTKRLHHAHNPTVVTPKAMTRIRRAKQVSRMSEKVAVGILSGVVKVAGFATQSVVNSKAGKKFFSLLPGEIVLASLDSFGKVFDAVEVAGKNVLTTSSVVTTGLVNH
ncbi:hypothetical protein KI387_026738, partial [Taxus chinensis]